MRRAREASTRLQWTAALANVTYLPGRLRRGRLPTARRSGKWDSQTPPLDQMPYHARSGGLVLLAGSRSTNGRKGGVGTRAHWRTGNVNTIKVQGTEQWVFTPTDCAPCPPRGTSPGRRDRISCKGGRGCVVRIQVELWTTGWAEPVVRRSQSAIAPGGWQGGAFCKRPGSPHREVKASHFCSTAAAPQGHETHPHAYPRQIRQSRMGQTRGIDATPASGALKGDRC